MTSITQLLADQNEAAAAIAQAEVDQKERLRQLYVPIERLYRAYEKAFEHLTPQARELGIAVPEALSDDDRYRWGNHSLKRITATDKGFTQIVTADYFRNEWDTCTTLIPTKYLADEGMALIARDAARVKAEIEAKRAATKAAAEAKRAAARGETITGEPVWDRQSWHV